MPRNLKGVEMLVRYHIQQLPAVLNEWQTKDEHRVIQVCPVCSHPLNVVPHLVQPPRPSILVKAKEVLGVYKHVIGEVVGNLHAMLILVELNDVLNHVLECFLLIFRDRVAEVE